MRRRTVLFVADGERTAVFILSSIRSGSTWVGYVLGSHPSSAFLGEFARAWMPENRVPCSWCHGNGIDICPVLGGVEQTPKRLAYREAFRRLSRPVLIDSSKWIAWASLFLDSDFEICLLHIMRDPRGWYASERRRNSAPLPALLRQWLHENRAFRDFARLSRKRFATAFYEDLAQSPEKEFERVARALDIPFDQRCLEYWTTPQHGFAANGASSMILRHLPSAKTMPEFITADDQYYAARYGSQFYDNRWVTELAPDERTFIESDNDINDFLGQYERELSSNGLAPLRR